MSSCHHRLFALRPGPFRLGLLLLAALSLPGRAATRPDRPEAARPGRAAAAPAPIVSSARTHPSLLPPPLRPRPGPAYRLKPPQSGGLTRAREPAAEPEARRVTPEQEQRYRAYVQSAAQFYREGRFEDAVKAWRRALLEKPGDAYALSDMGTAYLALRRLPEAVAAYREALLGRPDDEVILGNLTAAMLILGAAVEAEELILQYRVRQPPNKEYHPLLLLNLAGALALQKKDGPALEYLRQAAARDPVLVGAHLGDPEFAGMRESPEWQQIVAGLGGAAVQPSPAPQSPTSTLQDERSMK